MSRRMTTAAKMKAIAHWLTLLPLDDVKRILTCVVDKQYLDI